MDKHRLKHLRGWFLFVLLLQMGTVAADPIPVHHVEGVMFGFLVLRNLEGQTLAYGEWKQVWKGDATPVMDDLEFHFKDGSFYEENTKFTQRGKFRLISDHVVQRGPAFKQDGETWIDASTGKVTVKTSEKGVVKHLDLPSDVSNGMLFTLAKNLDPSAPETAVSMVAVSTKPRLLKLIIRPAEEKIVRVGSVTHHAQHYVVKIKIEGAAGKVAPLLGKQPPDIHLWILKSEAPTFVEFEGPLSEDSPVWRIELAAPEPDSPRPNDK